MLLAVPAGDVLLHTVTDAILGALSLPDIGEAAAAAAAAVAGVVVQYMCCLHAAVDGNIWSSFAERLV
jgi:2C-methyl-D-erythritol 2,4-cyclodiphosphate synthase